MFAFTSCISVGGLVRRIIIHYRMWLLMWRKKPTTLFSILFQRQKQSAFLPDPRTHSSWKKPSPGALSGIPHQDVLLRAVWRHNCLLRVAKGKPRKWEGRWLPRPSEGLWKDQNENWAGELRYQTCVLSVDSSAQVREHLISGTPLTRKEN